MGTLLKKDPVQVIEIVLTRQAIVLF